MMADFYNEDSFYPKLVYQQVAFAVVGACNVLVTSDSDQQCGLTVFEMISMFEESEQRKTSTKRVRVCFSCVSWFMVDQNHVEPVRLASILRPIH